MEDIYYSAMLLDDGALGAVAIFIGCHGSPIPRMPFGVGGLPPHQSIYSELTTNVRLGEYPELAVAGLRVVVEDGATPDDIREIAERVYVEWQIQNVGKLGGRAAAFMDGAPVPIVYLPTGKPWDGAPIRVERTDTMRAIVSVEGKPLRLSRPTLLWMTVTEKARN